MTTCDGADLFILQADKLSVIGYWPDNRKPVDYQGDVDFLGLLIPSKKKGYKFFFVQFADGDESLIEVENSCSISFRCLSQLLGSAPLRAERQVRAHFPPASSKSLHAEIDKRADDLISGRIKIVDSTRDELRKPTVKVLAAMKKDRDLEKTRLKVTPPESGFTLMPNGWHRSGTVLCSCGGKSYIIGQDEDMYFGCELADNPRTVAGAFLSLTPLTARLKLGVKRQGEWFVVPDNKVPAIEKCMAEFGEIDLPRDHPDSARHSVECSEGRISAKGVIFAMGPGRIVHSEGDHVRIELPDSQWFKFVRNTAVQSVSTEGVD